MQGGRESILRFRTDRSFPGLLDKPARMDEIVCVNSMLESAEFRMTLHHLGELIEPVWSPIELIVDSASAVTHGIDAIVPQCLRRPHELNLRFSALVRFENCRSQDVCHHDVQESRWIVLVNLEDGISFRFVRSSVRIEEIVHLEVNVVHEDIKVSDALAVIEADTGRGFDCRIGSFVWAERGVRQRDHILSTHGLVNFLEIEHKPVNQNRRVTHKVLPLFCVRKDAVINSISTVSNNRRGSNGVRELDPVVPVSVLHDVGIEQNLDLG